MSERYKEAGRIIAETDEGNTVEGTKLTSEKLDVAGNVIAALCPPLWWGIGVTETTTRVRTDDGEVHNVTKVVAEAE